MTELDIPPPILYKYIDWGKPYHNRMIYENEIYFSSFDEFNDPFEGQYPFQFREEDLTDENIVQYLYNSYQKSGKLKVGEEEAKRIIKAAVSKDNPLKNGTYVDGLKAIKNITEFFGVFCLSANKDNHLMWSHYSNAHKGLCIGFSTEGLGGNVNATLRAVIYAKDFPRVPLLGDFAEGFLPLLYTKSELWKYETEYRFFQTRAARTTVKLPNSAYSEIIFGCKMDDKIKVGIAKFALDNYPNIKLFESRLDKRSFKLNIIPFQDSK